MTDDDESTPDQELAKDIARALVGAGLIDAGKEKRVSAGLAKGTVTANDWRLFVELRPRKAPAGGG